MVSWSVGNAFLFLHQSLKIHLKNHPKPPKVDINHLAHSHYPPLTRTYPSKCPFRCICCPNRGWFLSEFGKLKESSSQVLKGNFCFTKE